MVLSRLAAQSQRSQQSSEKRPHCREGGFLMGDNIMRHWLDLSIAVGCSSHAVMQLLRTKWSLVLHAVIDDWMIPFAAYLMTCKAMHCNFTLFSFYTKSCKINTTLSITQPTIKKLCRLTSNSAAEI